MPKTERKTHTPAERAAAALGVEQRRVDKLTKKRDALNAELAGLVDEITDATKRRDYLAQHPDLPANAAPTAGRPAAKKVAGRPIADAPQA